MRLSQPLISGYWQTLANFCDTETLLVCNIKDVVWDQDAFNMLVLPRDTKDLIMALVTNKISHTQSTEFFHGKGNGLVILFHGLVGHLNCT